MNEEEIEQFVEKLREFEDMRPTMEELIELEKEPESAGFLDMVDGDHTNFTILISFLEEEMEEVIQNLKKLREAKE